MGQKVHSIGLRLGTNRKWKSSWFCDLNNYGKFVHLNLQIEKFIKTFLLLQPKKSILVDCKILKSWKNTIHIFVWFYHYRKNDLTNLQNMKQKSKVNNRYKQRKYLLTKTINNFGQTKYNKKENCQNSLINFKINKKFDLKFLTKSNVNIQKLNKDLIQTKLQLLRKKLSYFTFLLKQYENKNRLVSWYKINILRNKIQQIFVTYFFYKNMVIHWNKLDLTQPTTILWSNLVQKYKKQLLLKSILKKNISFQNYLFNLNRKIYRKNQKSVLNSVYHLKKVHRKIIKIFCSKNQWSDKSFKIKNDFFVLYKKFFSYQIQKSSKFQKIFGQRQNKMNYKLNYRKNFLIPSKKAYDKQFLKVIRKKQNLGLPSLNSIKILNGNQFLSLNNFYLNIKLRSTFLPKNLQNNYIKNISNILKNTNKDSFFFKYSFMLKAKWMEIFLISYKQFLKNYIEKQLKRHINFLYTAFTNYNSSNIFSKSNWFKFLQYYIQENLKKFDFKPIFYILEKNKKILYKHFLAYVKIDTWLYLYFYHYQKQWFFQNLWNNCLFSKDYIKASNKISEKIDNIILKKKLFVWKQLKYHNELIDKVFKKWKNVFGNKIKKQQQSLINMSKKQKKSFQKQYIWNSLCRKSRIRLLVNLHQYLYLLQNNKMFLTYYNENKDLNQLSFFEKTYSEKLRNVVPLTKKQWRQLKRLFFLSKKKKDRFLNILKTFANEKEGKTFSMNKNLDSFLLKKERKQYILKQIGSLMTIQNLKKSLHVLTKMNIKLIFINALSFVNFQYYYTLKKFFKKEKQKLVIQNRIKTLENISKNFTTRWRKLSFWTSDLVNISIISMFLKNTDLLARFISYQISFLPKNKKQTAFLKFLTKVVFNFKGERKEIVGFKMRFKGRFNRWSRTKKWVADVGNLWFQTYNVCLNYSYHKGVVKKGVFSTQIWLQYKKNFVKTLKTMSLTYFNYSKIKNWKKKLS